jgi:hypothetical protein
MSVRAPILVVAAALILTGCTQSPPAQMTYDTWPNASESAAPTQEAAGTAGLPMSSYSTVVDAPLMDRNAASTGEVAKPLTDSIAVHDSASGRPLALLSSAETVPVVGRSDGWVRVMLPSRRGLPGETPLRATVNGSTGWVKEADVTIEKAEVRLRLSKAEQRIDVLTLKGDKVIASFPATIGSEVPFGPTYVAPGIGTAECGVAPVKLNFQSETTAGYRGQPVSPVFIFGPAPECNYTAQDGADMAPRIIQLSPENTKEIAKLATPGTFMDVVLSTPPPGAWAMISAGHSVVRLP